MSYGSFTCREKNSPSGSVAMELKSYVLNAALFQELSASLAPMQIGDATQTLGDLRVIKSDTEMRYVREAARYTNIGLNAARNSALCIFNCGVSSSRQSIVTSYGGFSPCVS